MSESLPPLEPELASLLNDVRPVRAPADAQERVLARLALTLGPGVPPSGGSGGGGPAAPPPEVASASSAAATSALVVPAWALVAALALGVGAGFMARGAPGERIVYVDRPVAMTAPIVAPSQAALGGASAASAARTNDAVPEVRLSDLPRVSTSTARVSGDLAAERAMLDVARTALGRGDGAGTLAAAQEHSQKFPRGQLSEEREALAIQGLLLAGRKSEATARAKLFRQNFPKSLLMPAIAAATEAP